MRCHGIPGASMSDLCNQAPFFALFLYPPSKAISPLPRPPFYFKEVFTLRRLRHVFPAQFEAVFLCGSVIPEHGWASHPWFRWLDARRQYWIGLGLTRDRRISRILRADLAWTWSTRKLVVIMMAKGKSSLSQQGLSLTLTQFRGIRISRGFESCSGKT